MLAVSAAFREFQVQYPRNDVEIILVDNASTENRTQEAAELLIQLQCKFTIIKSSENHMAQARNLALQQAQHDNIIFLDADCHPEKSWLLNYKILKDKYMNHTVVAIGGENKTPSSPHFLYDFVRLLKKYPALHLNSPQVLSIKEEIKEVRHVPTCNVLYQKEKLIKIGGFDNRFRRAGEDLEMSSRLIRNGYKILFSNSVTVTHYDNINLLKWLKKIFHYGNVQPQILWMHPRQVDRERWIPILIIPTALFTLAILPKAFAPLVVLAFTVVLLLGLFQGAGKKSLPWTAFVFSTATAYCLGYLAGLSKFFRLKKD